MTWMNIAEVTDQRQVDDRLLGWMQLDFPVMVSRPADPPISQWQITNCMGKHHTLLDFECGEKVWIDLTGILYPAEIREFIDDIRAEVVFLSLTPSSVNSIASCEGATIANLDQLIKFDDWQDGQSIPYPRYRVEVGSQYLRIEML